MQNRPQGPKATPGAVSMPSASAACRGFRSGIRNPSSSAAAASNAAIPSTFLTAAVIDTVMARTTSLAVRWPAACRAAGIAAAYARRMMPGSEVVSPC